jgi:cytochrome b561
MPEVARYTRTAVVLHWIVALLMIVNVVLALTAGSLPEESTWIRPLVDTHKSIGITVLGLAALRLLWRFAHTPPALPTSYALWERRLSRGAHWLLYTLMFLLPISGWMHDSAWKAAAEHPLQLFGVVPWPRIAWIMNLDPGTKEQFHDLFGEIHELFGTVLYVLVGLHVVGALKHQFIDGQPELQRMKF